MGMNVLDLNCIYGKQVNLAKNKQKPYTNSEMSAGKHQLHSEKKSKTLMLIFMLVVICFSGRCASSFNQRG